VWNEPVRALVHALKFGDAPELAPALAARAWTTGAFAARPRPDALVPASLHRLRRRERGYDQSDALAQAFAPLAGAPAARWLRRRRATRQQARLGARERAANLAGAFEAIAPGLTRGRRIAVVDDVVTTGATGIAACEALARAGAPRVELWAIACEPLE
jgi:ComF family protein